MSRKIYLCLLLTTIIVQQGYKTKTQLQRLVEINIVQNTAASKKIIKRIINLKKDKKSKAPLKTEQQKLEIKEKQTNTTLDFFQ